MAYDGKLLARARGVLEARRTDNQTEHERRLRAVYERVPEIRQLDQQMRRQMMELVRVTIAGGADMPDKLERAAPRQSRCAGAPRRAAGGA